MFKSEKHFSHQLTQSGILLDVVEMPEANLELPPIPLKQKRSWQQQTAQSSLQKLLQKQISIEKNDHGKPFINDDYHISISHCQHKLGITASKHPIGLDLHHFTSKTERVSKKYLNDAELELCYTLPERQLFDVFWAAKEAVFKIFGVNLPFKDILLDYDADTRFIRVNLAKSKESFNLVYQTNTDFVLCLAQLVN